MSIEKPPYLTDILALIPEKSICIQPDIQREYAHDESGLTPYYPDILFLPETPEMIQNILKIATKYRIPVYTRGAGTATTGASIPTQGGILISFERMTALKIDTENRMIVTEPGVITSQIAQLAADHDLFYPPDPASIETCTIGGNVATNAGGPRCLKYGVTGHYVLGLDGFFADGSPFSFGGKRLKDVAGFDVMRLLIGSEGSLGIITSITLKLIPKPRFTKTLFLGFPRSQDAIHTLQQVMASAIYPSLCEFFDQTCMTAACQYSGQPNIHPDLDAFIILECDGHSEDDIDLSLNQVQKIAQANMGQPLLLGAKNANTPSDETNAIWVLRRSISPALREFAHHKQSHDISVPPAKIGDYLEALPEIGQKFGIHILGYGHLGDGNIHVNLLNTKYPDMNWKDVSQKAGSAILQLAIDMGGSISAEHGIGLSKKEFMPKQFSKSELGLFKKIKSAFDPMGLLNPEKIL